MTQRGIVVAIVLAVAGSLVGCDGGDSSSAPGDTTSASAGALTISSSAFDPASVVAGEGGALTITNQDGFDHTFTMDDGSIDEPVAGGSEVSVTITTAGAFHCEIHPSMTGTVSLG